MASTNRNTDTSNTAFTAIPYDGFDSLLSDDTSNGESQPSSFNSIIDEDCPSFECRYLDDNNRKTEKLKKIVHITLAATFFLACGLLNHMVHRGQQQIHHQQYHQQSKHQASIHTSTTSSPFWGVKHVEEHVLLHKLEASPAAVAVATAAADDGEQKKGPSRRHSFVADKEAPSAATTTDSSSFWGAGHNTMEELHRQETTPAGQVQQGPPRRHSMVATKQDKSKPRLRKHLMRTAKKEKKVYKERQKQQQQDDFFAAEDYEYDESEEEALLDGFFPMEEDFDYFGDDDYESE